MHKFKLVNNKWWAVDCEEIIYNEESLGRFSSNHPNTGDRKNDIKNGGAFAVIDTGTSIMGVPEKYHSMLCRRWTKQVNSVYDGAVACQGGLCISMKSCATIMPLLSNLTLRMGGKLFDLMPEAYTFNGADLTPEYKDTCIFGLMPLPGMVGGIDMFLLGDVFLRNFYSVYDF